ncbi:unnamed protein product, partial [Dovyalis caffra]
IMVDPPKALMCRLQCMNSLETIEFQPQCGFFESLQKYCIGSIIGLIVLCYEIQELLGNSGYSRGD